MPTQMKANEKHRARDAAKALRIKLAKAGKSTAPQGLRDNILSCLGGFGVLPPAVVAGYCPVGGEIDPLAAMQGLVARGFRARLFPSSRTTMRRWRFGNGRRTPPCVLEGGGYLFQWTRRHRRRRH